MISSGLAHRVRDERAVIDEATRNFDRMNNKAHGYR
jgi:hypothetical protein